MSIIWLMDNAECLNDWCDDTEASLGSVLFKRNVKWLKFVCEVSSMFYFLRFVKSMWRLTQRYRYYAYYFDRVAWFHLL